MDNEELKKLVTKRGQVMHRFHLHKKRSDRNLQLTAEERTASNRVYLDKITDLTVKIDTIVEGK